MRVESVLERTRLEPRPYQVRCTTKCVKMFHGEYRNGAGELEIAARSVLLESPVGSGKTSMALLTARYMQQRSRSLVAWAAMRRNLLHQAAGDDDRHNIGVQPNYISMFTTSLEQDHPELLPENRSQPLLLVVDEAQHDAANSMQDIHNLLRPDWVLGLSATPYRTDRVKLCFEKVVRDIGIHQLIQEGYLSQYHHYTVDDWTPEKLAEIYAREPQRWGSSLFFFLTFQECLRWQHRMQQLGLPVDVVTGQTDREQQIDDLKQGRVVALANMAVLTEGFNYPNLRTVWVRDSGKGPTIQMGGRVFRKPDDLSIRFKQVVQSKNTHHPMVRTALPLQQLVLKEDGWLTLKVNPRMEQISQQTRLAVARAEREVPDYIMERTTVRGRVRRRTF